MTFFMASIPPEIATPAYPKFPTNYMIGIISPERNCDFHADL